MARKAQRTVYLQGNLELADVLSELSDQVQDDGLCHAVSVGSVNDGRLCIASVRMVDGPVTARRLKRLIAEVGGE